MRVQGILFLAILSLWLVTGCGEDDDSFTSTPGDTLGYNPDDIIHEFYQLYSHGDFYIENSPNAVPPLLTFKIVKQGVLYWDESEPWVDHIIILQKINDAIVYYGDSLIPYSDERDCYYLQFSSFEYPDSLIVQASLGDTIFLIDTLRTPRCPSLIGLPEDATWNRGENVDLFYQADSFFSSLHLSIRNEGRYNAQELTSTWLKPGQHFYWYVPESAKDRIYLNSDVNYLVMYSTTEYPPSGNTFSTYTRNLKCNSEVTIQ